MLILPCCERYTGLLQAVAAVRDLLQVPLVNIGGADVADAHGKLVLAILWQLMRFHIRQLLAAVSSRGCALSDAELDAEVLSWANTKVRLCSGCKTACCSCQGCLQLVGSST